jgi:hypothetical protein
MKKILLGTIVLTAFSFSILLFQISCKKEAKAQTAQTAQTQQGKIIYLKSGQATTICTANYDGSNEQQINIAVPANNVIETLTAISPDRKTIFFAISPVNSTDEILYKCNVDGSNVVLVSNNARGAIAY